LAAESAILITVNHIFSQSLQATLKMLRAIPPNSSQSSDHSSFGVTDPQKVTHSQNTRINKETQALDTDEDSADDYMWNLRVAI
jgi:hypothetical protein